MGRNKLSEKKRVQLDFSPKTVETLDSLVEELDLGSRRELFNYILELFEWIVGQKRKARDLYSGVDKEDLEKCVLPVLERLKPN